MGGIYLLVGGNVGDRISYLNMAAEKIALLIGKVTASSSVWETEPWGFEDDTPFLNRLHVTDTRLEPHVLMQTISAIEQKLGRVRDGNKYGPRTIDIDILFYNDRVISEPGLVIPHPELHNRRFALEPLAEVNPSFIHPVLNKPIAEILAECDDPGSVRKLPAGEPEKH
ncbi:MAG: 2-amino-4-hydroxy-6-hydroxymethyldihydropteridine diphosphokinase [Marinilabiliales bacterium]|nr:MAG: 2-amino-4-hydroxy-6-hydroxymethyldihydropteridine diphosphokinase [Marinilabiliales bacterium]